MSTSIWFLGGVGTVTGSKFLIETKTTRILIDCGLFQGIKELRLQNRAPFPVDPASIDAVLLTHAHLDHCGYLPLLVKNGFKGKIYCTLPTRELSRIILLDAAKIQEEDAKFANKMGYSKHSPALPLYTTLEAKRSLKNFSPVDRDKWTKISQHIKFKFSLSGHILGSALIELDVEGRRIAFTGDLGRKNPLMLPRPDKIKSADYLVVESTYGDRVHTSYSPLRTLEKIVNDTFSRRGHLIIPSFALGRAQDLLYLFSKLRAQRQIPDAPIYLDSPMGIDATEVLLRFPDWHKLGEKEVKALCNKVVMVRNAKQSAELVRMKESSIVIAGSGMLSGGRVLHHLGKKGPDSRNTILLVGYQAAGTRGRLLCDGIPELKMFGQYIPIRAHVEEISTLSAHADQSEIIEWLKNFKSPPRKTFVVHGEPQAADALRVRITDALNWSCKVARPFERVEI